MNRACGLEPSFKSRRNRTDSYMNINQICPGRTKHRKTPGKKHEKVKDSIIPLSTKGIASHQPKSNISDGSNSHSKTSSRINDYPYTHLLPKDHIIK